jgi:CHAT domain-containing protein
LLPQAGWAHFACHGLADHDDPARSYLALYDRPMHASELFSMRMRSPYLAYLSACTTALGSYGLLDESIHLASAFQLAGFPHVVATLWSIGDFVAADMARDFYAAVHPDAHTWTPPAVALHTTVRAYRETYLECPHLWASHLHFGP